MEYVRERTCPHGRGIVIIIVLEACGFSTCAEFLPGPICPFWGTGPGTQAAQCRTSQSFVKLSNPGIFLKGKNETLSSSPLILSPPGSPLCPALQPHQFRRGCARCLHAQLAGSLLCAQQCKAKTPEARCWDLPTDPRGNLSLADLPNLAGEVCPDHS